MDRKNVLCIILLVTTIISASVAVVALYQKDEIETNLTGQLDNEIEGSNVLGKTIQDMYPKCNQYDPMYDYFLEEINILNQKNKRSNPVVVTQLKTKYIYKEVPAPGPVEYVYRDVAKTEYEVIYDNNTDIFDVNRDGSVSFVDSGIFWNYTKDPANYTKYGDWLLDVDINGVVDSDDLYKITSIWDKDCDYTDYSGPDSIYYIPPH